MRVVVCHPHKNAEIIDDAMDLNDMINKWTMVQGYYADHASMYGNQNIIVLFNQANEIIEDDRAKCIKNHKPTQIGGPSTLDFNREIGIRHKHIYGPIIFAGRDARGRYTSLDNNQIDYIMRNMYFPQKLDENSNVITCNAGDGKPNEEEINAVLFPGLGAARRNRQVTFPPVFDEAYSRFVF